MPQRLPWGGGGKMTAFQGISQSKKMSQMTIKKLITGLNPCHSLAFKLITVPNMSGKEAHKCPFAAQPGLAKWRRI
jgi:hypothetical protein